MNRDYTDAEAMVTELIRHIEDRFPSDWLLQSGDAPAESPSVDYSSQGDLVSHTSLHKNTGHEICSVLEGCMLLQVNDHIVRIAQGQSYVILPGIYHNELAVKGETASILWFIFNKNSVTIRVSGASPDGTFRVFGGHKVELEPVLSNLALSNITKELNSDQYAASELVKCHLLQLLLTVLRELKQAGKPTTTREWQKSVVRDVVGYIEGKSGHNIELAELVAYTNISANHLNHIFKTVTGKTIMNYCAERRIFKAKELLETGNLRIKEMAELLGYYDQYHFCKAFKKATGMSPTQYRAGKQGK